MYKMRNLLRKVVISFIVLAFFNSHTDAMKVNSRILLEFHQKLLSLKKDTSNPMLKSHPELVSELKILSSRSQNPMPLYLLNSTHQDIAWMDSPQKCELFRDTLVITPLLEKMVQDSNYHFDIEDVLMIREYLRRHPDRKNLIAHFLKNGQLNVGGAFNMPYEGMYAGESLVREFYQGSLWMKKTFHYLPDTYWNVDVPGRTLQMPQILTKAGIKMMVISRMGKGLFNWFSPDGSKILTFSPGHYGDLYFAFGGKDNIYKGLNYIAEDAMDMETSSLKKETGSITVPLLWDMDMASPASISVLGYWNNLSKDMNETGASGPITLPVMKYATSNELYSALEKHQSGLPGIRGERPDVWLYIHGPSHERALRASRKADILLPAAEKFSTIEALLEGDFNDYPVDRFAKAWEAKIYPDHGWGGKNGEITDNFFKQKFYFAREEGQNLLYTALREIAAKIKLKGNLGRPVVVFNSLSWDRDAPVTKELKYSPGQAFDIRVVNSEGKDILSQLSDVDYYSDHSIKSTKITFIARHVPSIGYETYYAEPQKKDSHQRDKVDTPTMVPINKVYESDYYRIQLGKGGLKSIFDKALNRELLNTSKFMGAEIFTMHSKGNGAGEFADIQQPDMEGFDKTSLHPTIWKLIEDGPVYTELRFRTPIKYADAQLTVILYKHLKRIDFHVDILNWEGVLYRGFRMAMPLKMDHSQVAYQVPFGILKVGEDELHRPAGGRYQTDCRLVHPREIENWISAGNGKERVTLSSSVAVADYIDPTDNPVDYTILQPILLASRRSCHSEGNEYLQTGSHHYFFSLSSGEDNLLSAAKRGQEANEHLFAITNFIHGYKPSLPESVSFFSVDHPNIQISAIKKAENKNAVIVRMFNQVGVESQVRLNSYFPIDSVQLTNIIELKGREIPSQEHEVKVKVDKYGIQTVQAFVK